MVSISAILSPSKLQRIAQSVFAALLLASAANHAVAARAGLCTDSVAVFECEASGGKQIALCGAYNPAGELTALQYRYGRGPRPELIYPAELSGSLVKFTSNHYLRYQTDYSQISFRNGPYAYSVYSNYDGEESPGSPKTAGVTVVTQAGAPVADISCKTIRKDAIQSITSKVTCDADQALGCSQ